MNDATNVDLASLARATFLVLSVPGATLQIPEGTQVAMDGVAGIVRWMKSDRQAVGFHNGDIRK